MLTCDRLKGIVAAVITPFTKKDEVDDRVLSKLIDHLIKSGVHGIMTTGGNGEFPHLLPNERKRVLEVAINAVKDRIPVMACTTGCSVKETLIYTKHAEEAGADAIILVPPFYYNLPPEQIFQFYKTITTQTQLPIVIYNNPGYTNNPIPPKLMLRIHSLKGIIGLKQSEYDISQTIEIIFNTNSSNFSVMTGIDSQLFPTLCVGGNGVFSTAACIIPHQMVMLYDLFQHGDWKKALYLHKNLQILNRFFEYDPGYVAPCKEALNMIGFPAGHVRPPLPPLTTKERVRLRDSLVKLGLLK